MSSESRALATQLPDILRWVKTRGLLLSPSCRFGRDEGGWIAWAPDEMSVSVVGRPSLGRIRKVRPDLPRDSEFLCKEKDADHLSGALPGHERDIEILHTPDPESTDLSAADRSEVRILQPGEEPLLEVLSPAWQREGMAEACGAHRIRTMMSGGREPVWGTSDANPASLALARKLGFRPVDRVVFFLAPISSG